MADRQLISFDWALKRLLRSKANFEILEGFLTELLKAGGTSLQTSIPNENWPSIPNPNNNPSFYQGLKIVEVLESESNQNREKEKSLTEGKWLRFHIPHAGISSPRMLLLHLFLDLATIAFNFNNTIKNTFNQHRLQKVFFLSYYNYNRPAFPSLM